MATAPRPSVRPTEEPTFCDVSLPVPVDQPFTYRIPGALQGSASGSVQVGCRVLVPFGKRTLTGVVLATHDNPPEVRAGGKTREVLRLIDPEPAFDEHLLKLARWIASYYCATLGETLRTMTPLSADVRRSKTYSLTSSGYDVARQLFIGVDPTDDPEMAVLKALEARPLSAAYLKKKANASTALIKSLEKKGLIEAEDSAESRDPLRAAAARLRVAFKERTDEKLPKPERELLAYLELHPGEHNVAALEEIFPKASPAARSLARCGLVHLKLEPVSGTSSPPRAPHPLNEHQQAAFDAISAGIRSGKFAPFLLEGVTGSGKTEVYMNAIDAALAEGRGALLLVPEIALTPGVAGQFHHRFGNKVAILHSAFHDSERAQEWRRVRSGEATVVVATRSGVFAPVQNLGLILVDEEHDGSYKQQDAPRYHGRDVAVVRARDANAVVVLGSATPSLETRYNSENGKYTRLVLPERIQQRPMPEVSVIDMTEEFREKGKQNTFSAALVEAVNERLENGEQAMLLLNRRGFSSFVTCRSCGERIECANCSVTLTYHKRDRRLLCHYCNYAEPVPDRCPACDSEHIQFLGVGSERVEQELHDNFPGARIARLDRDTVRGKRDFESILTGFREHKYDLLVGTQMIAKGHDIPNVTLVGIINADIGLGLPDFRAAERTFQLLTQAAGRAGRGGQPGIVLIQTVFPDHYAIRCAAAQDYQAFYEKEIDFRRHMRYPPFGALANLLIRAADQEEALARSNAISDLLKPPPKDIRIMGPAPAAVPKLKAEFRYQMLLKSTSRARLAEVVQKIRQHTVAEKWNTSTLAIDIDPVSLL